VCLTFNLRGHAETEPQHETVTREDNLRDLAAAYDMLASQPLIDRASIAVVGKWAGGVTFRDKWRDSFGAMRRR
jgi:hypothetical protein